MDELWGTIKSFLIKGAVVVIVITGFLLFVFGPKDAAGFIGWIGDTASDAGSKVKIFIEELKK